MASTQPLTAAQRLRQLLRHWRQPLIAWWVTFIAFFVISALAKRPPFGAYPLGMGDTGWQIMPFAGAFIDTLTGQTASSLTFNWELGLGMPFLADYATYTSGPLMLLVALFPRANIALALVVITAVSVASAAAAMVVLLQHLVSRTRSDLWLWGLIYANTGWLWEYGYFRTMWLNGLIFLPLFCLVAVWAQRRERLVTSILIIGLGWYSNYYTAYMISLAAGLFALAYAFESLKTGQLRDRLVGVGIFALRGLLGVGLVAALLLPTYLHVRAGIDFPGRTWVSPQLTESMRTFFPGASVMYNNPNLFIGSIGLISLLVFFFSPTIAARRKIVWGALVALTAVSMFTYPLALVWNIFDAPNGTWFRASFICGFFLILLAAFAWRHVGIETVPSLLAGLALVVMLGLSVRAQLNPGSFNPLFYVGASLALIVIAFVLYVRRSIGKSVVTILIAVTVVAESIGVASATGSFQSRFLAHTDIDEPLVREVRTRLLSTQQVNAIARINPEVPPYNIGGLYGVRNLSYYSSATPVELRDFAARLGLVSAAGGRMVAAGTDMVITTMAGGKTIVENSDKPVRFVELPAMPFAYEIDPEKERHVAGGDVLGAREAFFQTDLYYPPAAISVDEAPLDVDQPANFEMKANQHYTLSVTCQPQQVPQLVMHTPGVLVKVGKYDWKPYPAGAVVSGISSQMNFVLVSGNDTTFAMNEVKCAHTPAAFDYAKNVPVIAAKRAGATVELTAQNTNPIGLTTMYSPNWSCTNAKPYSRIGWLALEPESPGNITCHYRVAGLTPGLVISGAVALLLLVIGALRLRARSKANAAEKNRPVTTGNDEAAAQFLAAPSAVGAPRQSERSEKGAAVRLPQRGPRRSSGNRSKTHVDATKPAADLPASDQDKPEESGAR